VTLVNESVPDGITLHWHGVDVPNAADGVAGVTQDAVPLGGQFVYRFRTHDAGTYWYHSHQVSHVQVRDGLFGVLVVDPAVSTLETAEAIVPVHTYDGQRTAAGGTGLRWFNTAKGATVRARIINTDDSPVTITVSGAPYRVVAHDGRDINDPPSVSAASIVLAGGGRVDVSLTVPDGAAAARLDSAAVLCSRSARRRPWWGLWLRPAASSTSSRTDRRRLSDSIRARPSVDSTTGSDEGRASSTVSRASGGR